MPKLEVAISGSTGFIGSALSRKLEFSKKYSISPISHSELQDPKQLEKHLKRLKPDYIFHLSAYGNHSTQGDDQQTFDSNVVGTWNLLKASLNIPYRAFINVGSSSEYGEKTDVMSERDLPEATTMYGCTKVAGTYLARAFARKYNKPIVTVRPFSVYGPGEADFRFIPTVIRCLLTGQKLKLDKKPTHDWIYIDDFLDGLGTVADSADFLSGQVVNIGTGLELSNADVVTLLKFISKKQLKIENVASLRPQDSSVWRADIKKLSNFNWEPIETPLSGLLNTYKYYEKKYNAN